MKSIKKKLTLILLLMFALLLFAACGGEESSYPPYERGTVTEDGFESAWIGLKWTCPEAMIMVTEDELDEIMESSVDIAFGEDGEELLDYAKLTSVYEMMATTVSGTPNVIVMTEKIALKNMTETQYLEAVGEGLNYSTGEYIGGEIESATVAGMEFTVQAYSVSMQGVEISQNILSENRTTAWLPLSLLIFPRMNVRLS